MSAAASTAATAATGAWAPSYVGAKLYYTPTSCSFASVATAFALGLKGLKLELVSLNDHKTSDGGDFYAINPKGNVPAMVLADGTVLNENVAILLFIGDQNPSGGLTAAPGTIERVNLVNQLAYLASEIHGAFGGFFGVNDSNRVHLTGIFEKRVAFLDKMLTGKSYIANNKLSVADIYAYLLIGWHAYLKLDLTKYPNVSKYWTAIGALDIIKNGHTFANAKPTVV